MFLQGEPRELSVSTSDVTVTTSRSGTSPGEMSWRFPCMLVAQAYCRDLWVSADQGITFWTSQQWSLDQPWSNTKCDCVPGTLNSSQRQWARFRVSGSDCVAPFECGCSQKHKYLGQCVTWTHFFVALATFTTWTSKGVVCTVECPCPKLDTGKTKHTPTKHSWIVKHKSDLDQTEERCIFALAQCSLCHREPLFVHTSLFFSLCLLWMHHIKF